MIHRLSSLLLFVVAASNACGGTTSASNGGSDAAGGGSNAGGGDLDSTGGDTGSSDGSDAGDAGSCADLADAAQSVYSAAVTAASADLGCASDSDCTPGGGFVSCLSGCGSPLTTTAGEAVIQKAVDLDNTTTCARYAAMGCPPPEPLPCVYSSFLGVACVEGKCAEFPPAAWTSFAFDEQPATSGYSIPPMCAAGTTCSLWTVTPDAKVAVVDPQGTHDATLSTADFATVDGILRSMAFRQNSNSNSGFMCGVHPSGTQGVAFDQSRGGRIQGVDVTGCVFATSGNDLQTLFDIVKTY
jgi:hypothetical protein